MEPERFRVLFWNRCLPLLAAPVLGFMLYVSPAAAGWPLGAWIGIGAVAAVLAGVYLRDASRKAQITLDEQGVTVFTSSWQTYRWDRLLKVRQVGAYRVRMCIDAEAGEQHGHVALDVVRADAFVDALRDWCAEITGEELPAGEETPRAA